MTSARSALLLLLTLAPAVRAQAPCAPAADSLTNAAWTRYRADDLAGAATAFSAARAACPTHLGAGIGLGYVALRRDDLHEAGARFGDALRQDSTQPDALYGLGLVALRRGDRDSAAEWFRRVLARDPSHAEARAALARIPQRPVRAPLVLPETVVTQARTRGERFEVPVPGGWTAFYIRGINLGAALPGRFPGEFPDSATYAEWIRQMTAMGANTVRVYTIHPPHFYQALRAHNTTHTDAPLWLVHGVWTELPPGYDFDDPSWTSEFVSEGHRVVDVVHGRADLPDRPGHAAGPYTADVSRWTLSYLVGREWEPFAVAAFDSANPGRRAWHGRYLQVEGGTATDVWLTRICDALVAYETATYRHQRPVAYTNWPTLDPLTHVTEATVAEELALRARAGERRDAEIREYDNDRVAVDPSLVHATAGFRGGFYASYHAYPYYPDFIVLGGGYATYLARLRAHHRGMPLVIAEYGVPVSMGIAHIAGDGAHHGGHTEMAQARINADLTRLLAAQGMAGGMLFAWIDEWFKKNWVTIDVELPGERKPLWLSRLNAENMYGVIAMEPAPRLAGARLTDRLGAWRGEPAFYGGRMRAMADEAALHLYYEPAPGERADSLLIGLDVRDPATGAFRWPGRRGPALPFGLEFIVAATPDVARVLSNPDANPFRVRRGSELRPPSRPLAAAAPPAGFFTGPYDQQYNLPLRAVRREDGRFDTLRVVTNRRRLGRDLVEYAAAGYERGALPAGPGPDGSWERDSVSGAFELRVPWGLIGISDPSSRSALASTAGPDAWFVPEPVPSIGLALAVRGADGRWQRWPAPGMAGERFTWPAWEQPTWRARVRPVFDAMREAFRTVDYRADGR